MDNSQLISTNSMGHLTECRIRDKAMSGLAQDHPHSYLNFKNRTQCGILTKKPQHTPFISNNSITEPLLDLCIKEECFKA